VNALQLELDARRACVLATHNRPNRSTMLGVSCWGGEGETGFNEFGAKGFNLRLAPFRPSTHRNGQVCDLH